MKRRMASRQGGAALLVLLGVLALGASWFMVSRLDAMTANATARNRHYNAEVLARAKQALIGYVVQQANKSFEDNPGALPCPEHPWYINRVSPDNGLEGTAGPSVGMSNPGAGTANCSSIGRFPWRTVGTEVFSDAAGEPLWLVVGPSWRKTSSSTKTTINSNSAGDLTLDGQPAVALIIAPGRVLNASAGTTAYGVSCSARNQARTSPVTYTVDPLDYLECYNGATLAFSSVGPDASFNDHAVKITVEDLMPGIEAAVAERMGREIVPALKTVFVPATWGIPGANPVLPYPADATFTSPGPGGGTSQYRGAAGNYKGLLPFAQTQGCTESTTDLRCTTTTSGVSATNGTSAFLGFAKSGADTAETLVPPLPVGWIRTQSTCSWSGTVYTCTGEYQLTSIRVTLTMRVTNVAMGLRTYDDSLITCTAKDDVGAGIGPQNIGCLSKSVALQSDGSALLTVTTNWTPDIVTAGWGTYANYVFAFDRAVFGDHALLDTANPTTGWFVRNEWHRLAYYAVSPSNTAIRLAAASPAERSCSALGDCLTVTNLTPSPTVSAVLILAGRSVNGSSRPSSTLANYLEGGNAGGASPFVKQTVVAGNASPTAMKFNDRFAVSASN